MYGCVHISVGSWNFIYVYMSVFGSCFNTQKFKTKMKIKKRVWILILCEDSNWNCSSLKLLSCLTLTYSPLLLYFIWFLGTCAYIPHFFLSPITTFKSPLDLYVHVFWLLILEASQVYMMFVF